MEKGQSKTGPEDMQNDQRTKACIIDSCSRPYRPLLRRLWRGKMTNLGFRSILRRSDDEQEELCTVMVMEAMGTARSTTIRRVLRSERALC